MKEISLRITDESFRSQTYFGWAAQLIDDAVGGEDPTFDNRLQNNLTSSRSHKTQKLDEITNADEWPDTTMTEQQVEISFRGDHQRCTNVGGDNQPPIIQNPGSSEQRKIVEEDPTSPNLTQDTRFIRATQDTTPSVEHNIVYNDKDQIKGGTLDALVERLTSPNNMDLTFTQTFLLTFKTFTTAEEFFDKLMRRYAPTNI